MGALKAIGSLVGIIVVGWGLVFLLVYWHQQRQWERETRRADRETTQRAHHDMHREIVWELPDARIQAGMPPEEVHRQAMVEWREYAEKNGLS